jgi:uncharacterized Zn finger protein
MAIRLACDGCDCDVTAETATKHGSLAVVYYCADCGTTWKAHAAREREEMLACVQQFEAWRAAARQDVRKTLKALPDD